MASAGLPPGFDLLFNSDEDAAGRVLDVDLPPGRLVEPKEQDARDGPAYWLSDEPVGPDLWIQLHKAHPGLACGRCSPIRFAGSQNGHGWPGKFHPSQWPESIVSTPLRCWKASGGRMSTASITSWNRLETIRAR